MFYTCRKEGAFNFEMTRNRCIYFYPKECFKLNIGGPSKYFATKKKELGDRKKNLLSEEYERWGENKVGLIK